MGSRFFRFIGTVLLLCALVGLPAFLAGPGLANAQDKDEAKVISPDGYKPLALKAQDRGHVRIIVGVSAKFAPEAGLSKAEVQAQRAAIAGAQDRVLSGLSAKGLAPVSSHKYKYVPFMAMSVDTATLDALLASPQVESIEEDIPVPPTESWNMTTIGADVLHTAAVTGKDIAVAILDTGVQKTHPYLTGAVVSEACYSSSDAGYGNWSVCPGGVTDSTAVGSALPYGGTCPTGECDHGTHVAGIVAGRSGVAGNTNPGVAPEASIIAIQVFTAFPGRYCIDGGSCAMSFTSDQIKGLERVLELAGTYTIASVNMSLGGGKYSTTKACDNANKSRKAIIDSLRAAGIATVIATGNSGYCGFTGAPGCISSAVSIGATDSSDLVASYSNSATFMSLFAPGSGIYSSIPATGYASWNGTSMATPHVAGAWALMKQKYPSASVTDILTAFNATGTSITDTGKCSKVTKKRINVDDAYNKGILVATIAGTKKGTLTATDLVCPVKDYTCLGAYTSGSSVVVTAVPATGSFLDSWEGCTSSDGPVCTVTVDSINKVTAVFNPPPKATVSPMAINFPTLKIGTTPSPIKKITVKNTGTSTLEDIGYVKTGDTQFAIDGTSTCGKTLAKGESCYIYITFTPDAAISFTGLLTISSTDPKKGTINVSLKGKGKN